MRFGMQRNSQKKEVHWKAKRFKTNNKDSERKQIIIKQTRLAVQRNLNNTDEIRRAAEREETQGYSKHKDIQRNRARLGAQRHVKKHMGLGVQRNS